MELALSFPFTLGIVAAFNPCGFAMLPAYLSYFMGLDDHTATTPKLKNILRALLVGLVLTAGFVAVFGTFGLLFAKGLSLQAVSSKIGYFTAVFGVLLIPIGITMLAGHHINLRLPKLNKGTSSRDLSSVFMFGISYAVVSLSCTIPLFIAGISATFATQSFTNGVANFVAYAVGMGAVITFLTVSLAMAKSNIAHEMRRFLPHINRISGLILIFAGLYLVNYGIWELQVINNPTTRNPLVERFQDLQTALSNWMSATTPQRIGVLALLGLAGALLIGWRDTKPDPVKRRSITATYLTIYLTIELAFNQGNFIALPILRFITNWPARITHWITNPIRAAVPLEMAFIALTTLWATHTIQHRPTQPQPTNTNQQPIT